MQNRFVSTRLLKLGSIATLGMLLQTGGCALNPADLLGSLITTAVNLTISSFVTSAFGVGGFGF